MILELSTDRSLERAKAAAMLLSSGWGWKEAPSGPVQPCHAECSWGCTAGLGTKDSRNIAAACADWRGCGTGECQ